MPDLANLAADIFGRLCATEPQPKNLDTDLHGFLTLAEQLSA
jgi:hypothetical protein